MKRIKELNMDQVDQFIEQCGYRSDPEHDCTTCPLFGECLYYYAGDDSELYREERCTDHTVIEVRDYLTDLIHIHGLEKVKRTVNSIFDFYELAEKDAKN